MKYTITTCALAALSLIGCKDSNKNTAEDQVKAADSTAMQHTDTSSKATGEWTALFDGQNMEGWHAYNGDEPTQWSVEDNVLVLNPAENRKGTENLITDKQYTDFTLSLDWKISEGGNSGVMWAVQEDQEYHEPYATGPEIQILDDERHPDSKAGRSHQSGALYDMIPPGEDVVNPAGEWNSMTITIDHKNNKGSVDLNGSRVVDFPVNGEDWQKLVNESKFADWKAFAKTPSGHIALQDHNHKVSFRNIKIKEL